MGHITQGMMRGQWSSSAQVRGGGQGWPASWTPRGIKVVLLEAGARQSLDSFPSQVPGEAFAQLDLNGNRAPFPDPRRSHRTHPTCSARTCKTLGGNDGATDRRDAAHPALEVRARSTYGDIKGASLTTRLIEIPGTRTLLPTSPRGAWVVTRRNGKPGPPASNHFKVMRTPAQSESATSACIPPTAINTRPRGRAGPAHSAGVLRPGLQDRRQVEHAGHRDPARRGDGQPDLRT